MIPLRKLSIALAIGSSLATTATADTPTFQFGFEQACFGSIPNLDNVIPTLNDAGWDTSRGPIEGIYEFVANGTHLYLLLDSDSGGCAVVDPEVSTTQAEEILEAALNDFASNHSSSNRSKGVNNDGDAVWQLDLGDMFPNAATVSFYVDAASFNQDYGLDGGGAISFRITQ